MPAPLGGIGQQVADNLFELGKSMVQSAGKAGSDIVKGTFEQISGAPSGVGATTSDKANNPTEAPPEQSELLKKQKENQRYQQVRTELEQYRQRKQQLDNQIARERSQQEQESKQKQAVEKQEKESFVQKMLRKVGAGAHGETVKQKE